MRLNSSSSFALLLTVAAATAACATRGAPSAPVVPVMETANEARARSMADSLRRFVLARATFAEIGDSCDSGVLRTFTGDTVPEERTRTEQALEQLERIVVTQGIDAPDGTPAQVALLQTVVAWEGGGARPLYDVPTGERATRRPFAPGLIGRYTEGESGKCKRYIEGDTATIVIPVVGTFTAPAVKDVRLLVLQGDSALLRERDAFFARNSGREDAIFTYTKVRAAVTWENFAVAAVNRPAQSAGGTRELSVGGGGASYLFHRADGQWRLLAVVRSWGS